MSDDREDLKKYEMDPSLLENLDYDKHFLPKEEDDRDDKTEVR